MTNLCVWQDLLEFSSAFAFASTDEGVSESDQLGLEECLSNNLDDGAALVAILQPKEKDWLGDTDEAASSLPAHLSPVTSPISIGEIFLTTGENMVSRGDGFVSTTAVGSLPSVCPRGVLLVSGSWYSRWLWLQKVLVLLDGPHQSMQGIQQLQRVSVMMPTAGLCAAMGSAVMLGTKNHLVRFGVWAMS